MRERQKLDGKNICTPVNASLALRFLDMYLNREETLGVHGLKTPSNNPDVDIQPGMTGKDLGASVINMHNMKKSILIKGDETKMDISTKNVKIVGYGRELRFTRQFPPRFCVGFYWRV